MNYNVSASQTGYFATSSATSCFNIRILITAGVNNIICKGISSSTLTQISYVSVKISSSGTNNTFHPISAEVS